MRKYLQYKIAEIFGFPVTEMGLKRLVNMAETLKKTDGLTFDISYFEDGWTAVCEEYPAISTGGTNPNPTQKETMDIVRDAIFAAFNIPARLCNPNLILSEHEIMEEIKSSLNKTTARLSKFSFAYGE